MTHNQKLPQFENDYIISWDVSDKDLPCVAVSLLRRDEKGVGLEAEFLGHSFERTGVVSLRQLLEQHETLKRAEAERMKGAERLRKTFIREKEGN